MSESIRDLLQEWVATTARKRPDTGELLVCTICGAWGAEVPHFGGCLAYRSEQALAAEPAKKKGKGAG